MGARLGLTGGFVQHIFDSVKESLQRLQLDHIDVLQCERGRVIIIWKPTLNIDLAGHRFDYETPIEETVRACNLQPRSTSLI